MKERLQKILSRAGVASRREAERLLAEGRIRVNGRVVTQPGTTADPEKDAIRVNGRVLPSTDSPRTTVALNKPRGVISSRTDPRGRKTVVDLVRGVPQRLYPVGRLDYNAEGLILLTNDGDLAYRLLRPGSAERVYHVKVSGRPSAAVLDKLRHGVRLDGRKTLPARIRVLRGVRNSWIEIGLHEGRRNQIVRMFRKAGHPVMRLRRVRIGPLTLGTLRLGRYRFLTERESERLAAAAGPPRRSPSRRPPSEPGRKARRPKRRKVS